MKALVGDIGATNSRLALARTGAGRDGLEGRSTYRSGECEELAELVSRYLDEVGQRPRRATLGVAAPVRDGRAHFVNLDWEVDGKELAVRVGLDEVRLVNDFEAICHALPLLDEGDLARVLPGTPEPRGAVAVLGAGTGLGHGFVTRSGGEARVQSSEAGHTDFAPRTPLQDALLRWLRDRHGHVSFERVVSGPGLLEVHRFLVATGRGREDPKTAERLEAAVDPPAVITRRALDGADPTCRRALRIFVAAYGAQAGNVALAVQATGGVYLAGGIAPEILPALRGEVFERAFRDRGSVSRMMEDIPVRVITPPDAGLLGAARVAAR